MSKWVIKGLRTGVKTTRYPRIDETAAGTSPGFPSASRLSQELAPSLVARCPTDALQLTPDGVDVNLRRCVHCFRCVRGTNSPLNWQSGYECALSLSHDDHDNGEFGAAFRNSLQILVIDTGDCGACLNEVKQLNNPYYNIHRLGFFLTPSPRHADVMLVVGAITDHMRVPLLKAYEAMPGPKRVMAVGACALTGGVFGPSFMCAGGLAEALRVDVEVPGNPPPPLAILHGLLVAAQRKPSANSHRKGGRAPMRTI
jgi:Ni,Fe-hydrogenase III small subunit